MRLLLLLALLFTQSALAETKSAKKKVTPRPTAVKSTPAPAKPKTTPEPESPAAATPSPERAPNASLEPAELAEFAAQPARVRELITSALALTKRNLTYTYGSADPEKGGMDCSGTIHHLLVSSGFKDVPRDSSGQYVWVRKAGEFRAVVSKSEKSFEFSELLPGDLLFWSGTYSIEREIPITHVMLYLGTEKKTKKRVMFGASDGRSYAGVQRWGVSVFDFKMPRIDPANPEKAKVDFVGYGRIPGLHEAASAAAE
jgi:cell wall-associated NlpC family hydrolase